MKISTRITNARRKRFLTQKYIANAIGIKRCTYASYEENRYDPPLKILLKLCIYYGISIEELTGSLELVK